MVQTVSQDDALTRFISRTRRFLIADGRIWRCMDPPLAVLPFEGCRPSGPLGRPFKQPKIHGFLFATLDTATFSFLLTCHGPLLRSQWSPRTPVTTSEWSIMIYMLLTETLDVDDRVLGQVFNLPSLQRR